MGLLWPMEGQGIGTTCSWDNRGVILRLLPPVTFNLFPLLWLEQQVRHLPSASVQIPSTTSADCLGCGMLWPMARNSHKQQPAAAKGCQSLPCMIDKSSSFWFRGKYKIGSSTNFISDNFVFTSKLVVSSWQPVGQDNVAPKVRDRNNT